MVLRGTLMPHNPTWARKIFPYWWHEINFFQNEVCKQQKIQIQTQIQIHCESTSKVKITAPIVNMWVLLRIHNARTTIVEAPTSSSYFSLGVNTQRFSWITMRIDSHGLLYDRKIKIKKSLIWCDKKKKLKKKKRNV